MDVGDEAARVKREPRRDKPGFEASRDHPSASGTSSRKGNVRVVQLLAAGLALLIVAWLALTFALGRTGVVAISQQAWRSILTMGELDKVLSALVLFLLAADRERLRLGWMASGLLTFGLGAFAFVGLASVLDGAAVGAGGVSDQLYRRIVTWTVAFALFAVGLVPKAPPRFSWRWALATLAGFGVLVVTVSVALDSLPPLSTADRREISASIFDHAVQPGLTAWDFAFSMIPLSLGIIASVAAVRRNSSEALSGWLVAAMVLLAGSQLHALFWPLSVGSALTAPFLLHFAAGTTIILGGIVELRRIAAERGRLLAVGQDHLRRMRELAVLKADFTAMVAHELASPLAAIRGYADMLSTGKLSTERRARILDEIRAEADRLNALVADVRAAAAVERADFSVRIVPVDLDILLADAAAYASTLPGAHPLTTKISARGRVLADADRIGQVLRNLLDNAATYSPEGAPIELRATPAGSTNDAAKRVRIEVADRGPGIRPDDLGRIFEKFGRGKTDEEVAGTGLGLYLSMRIVRAHGSEITVDSGPGQGSVFAFDLETAR